MEVFANSTSVEGMPEQDNSFITVKFKNGSTCVIAYLADGDKKYPKEKIYITGYKTNIEFNNFKSVTVYKNGKIYRKNFLMIDKGQQEEMRVLIEAVKNGNSPISFTSLVLSCYTTILAIESIKTKTSFPVSIQDIV